MDQSVQAPGPIKRAHNAFIVGRDIWSNRPLLDWVAVGVVVGAHALVLERGWWHWHFTVSAMAKDDRMRAFVTAGSVSAFLFGFATGAIAFFYGSAKGDRNDLLRKVMGDQLVATWNAAIGAPLLVVGVVGLGLFFDTGTDGKAWIGWSLEVSLLLLVARCVRLRWLFVRTLSLEARDAVNPPIGASPARPSVAQKRPVARRTTEKSA